MGIKNAAAKHFSQLRELQGPIPVPEWIDDETGEAAEIYFRLLNENDRIGIKASMQERDNSVNAILARRALDKEGKRIWKDIEVQEMDRTLDPDIVERILESMAKKSVGVRKNALLSDEQRMELAACESDEATDEDIKNS